MEIIGIFHFVFVYSATTNIENQTKFITNFKSHIFNALRLIDFDEYSNLVHKRSNTKV